METAATFLWGEPPDVFGLCDVTERRVALPAGTVVEVAPLDSDRVFLGFYCDFPVINAPSVSMRGNVAAGEAQQVGPTDPVEMSFYWHGPLVSQQWFGISGGAFNISVVEVFYRRRYPKPSEPKQQPWRAPNAIRTLLRWCKGKGE